MQPGPSDLFYMRTVDGEGSAAQGPYTWEQILAWRDEGRIHAGLLFSPDNQSWTLAANMPGLLPATGAPPPPASVPPPAPTPPPSPTRSPAARPPPRAQPGASPRGRNRSASKSGPAALPVIFGLVGLAVAAFVVYLVIGRGNSPAGMTVEEFRARYQSAKEASGDIIGLNIVEFFALFGEPDKKMKMGGTWLWAAYRCKDGEVRATFGGPLSLQVIAVSGQSDAEAKREEEAVREREEAARRWAEQQARQEREEGEKAEQDARAAMRSAEAEELRVANESGAPDWAPLVAAYDDIARKFGQTSVAAQARARRDALREKKREGDAEALRKREADEAERRRKRELQEAARLTEERARAEAIAAQRAERERKERVGKLVARLRGALERSEPEARQAWHELAGEDAEHPLLAETRPALTSLPIPPGAIIPLTNVTEMDFGDHACVPDGKKGLRVLMGANAEWPCTVDLGPLTAATSGQVRGPPASLMQRIVQLEWKRDGIKVVRVEDIRSALGSKGPKRSDYDTFVRCLPGNHVSIGEDVYRTSPRKHLGPYRRGSSNWGDLFFGLGGRQTASDLRVRMIDPPGSYTYTIFLARRSGERATLGVARLRKKSLSGVTLGTIDVYAASASVVPYEVVPYGEKEALLVVTPDRVPTLVGFKGEEMENLAYGPAIPPGLVVGSPTAMDLDENGRREYVAPVKGSKAGQVGFIVLLTE